MKKSRNGNFTVYEENDKCALDEYSEKIAEELEITKEGQDDKIKTNSGNIKVLQAENIELKAENERLREDLNNTVPSVSGEGENVTLNGTAEARFKKLEIQGNSWQETRSGKNLFNALNITNSNITVNNNGQEIVMPITTSGNGITGTGRTLSQLCPNLKVGDVVYLYFNTNSNYNTLIYLHGTNESWRINTSKTITEEMLSGNVSLYGNRYQDGETNQVTISNLIITKVNNSTWEQYGAMPSTEFESPIQNVTGSANVKITNRLENTDTNYKEQTFTFPLQEGQKLMKGDYLADDGIHHKRKQKVLDGTENWKLYDDSNENYISFYIYNIIQFKTNNILCTHFKKIFYGNFTQNGIALNFNNGTYYLMITIEKKELQTPDVNGLKTFLASQKSAETPVTFEYELDEEEIEPYTLEQQVVYNEIKKAYTYKNITHIFSEDETSPIFDAEALADIETMFNNLQAQILVGEV